MRNKIVLSIVLLNTFLNSFAQNKWKETQKSTFNLIENPGGKTLGYSPASGVKIITVNGFAFKDLNRNGKLDKYEDWRLSYDERAKDLATKLSIEEIAGLMLYSAHQSIPARAGGYFAGTYNGKPFKAGETDPTELTDQQKKFLKDDNLRHVLITTVQTPAIAAQWNNKLQSFCESFGFGLSVNGHQPTAPDEEGGSSAAGADTHALIEAVLRRTPSGRATPTQIARSSFNKNGIKRDAVRNALRRGVPHGRYVNQGGFYALGVEGKK